MVLNAKYKFNQFLEKKSGLCHIERIFVILDIQQLLILNHYDLELPHNVIFIGVAIWLYEYCMFAEQLWDYFPALMQMIHFLLSESAKDEWWETWSLRLSEESLCGKLDAGGQGGQGSFHSISQVLHHIRIVILLEPASLEIRSHPANNCGCFFSLCKPAWIISQIIWWT